MKFTVTIIGTVLWTVTTAQFYTDEQLHVEFKQFKNDYNRSYSSAAEEQVRKQIFIDNLNYIFRHNREAAKGGHSFTLGLNEFADFTSDEFVRTYASGILTGPKVDRSNYKTTQIHMNENLTGLPDSFDWTEWGFVTPVKYQGACGSCWAFSAIAPMESLLAVKSGRLVSLSEQNLIDCSYDHGNHGCKGGLPYNAFAYVYDNEGIEANSTYPYTGTSNSCKFKATNVAFTIYDYTSISYGDEWALASVVAVSSPVSVIIDASHKSFQLYKSGVYDEPACSTSHLNHAVAVVGYGMMNTWPYWKVKNSWGTSWGDQGYILMHRNKGNQCGIASYASYPIVD